MMRRAWGIGLALIGIAACGALAYRQGLLSLAYPAPSHPLGIDVSRHQGQVDWERLDLSKTRFAYIKASEGGDLRDTSFRANASGALKVGLAAGAYHYFTLCRPGVEQAANFLRAIKDTPLSLRPAVDLEYVGNCSSRPTREAFGRELTGFITALDAAGYKPIFYSTRRFYSDYLTQPQFEAYPLWLRDTIGPLSSPVGRDILIWQFADNVRLTGISGPVDRNALMGPLSELLIER